MIASPCSPSRIASSTRWSGPLAPSRKLKLEWQCSSAYGVTGPSGRATSTRVRLRLRVEIGASGSWGVLTRPERRFSSSPQEIGGLLQPIS